MNTKGFNDAHVYDSIVLTGTAPEPEISTIHQNRMVEETLYTSMPTCQPGMPPIQPQQCGMGSPVEHGAMEEPRYTATPTCQPGMTPLQPGSMVPPPPYSPKLYPPPAYHIALQQQPVGFHFPDQPSPADPDHPGGPGVPKQSFVGPMVLSCIAFWFCGVLFGLIAWIVAVIGRDKPGASTRRRYATVSYMFSFIGIVTGIILIIVLSMTLIGSNPTCDSDEYYDSGSKKCCEYNRCWYGTSYYDGGCLKCCEYNNYYCGSAGSYLDSNGCRQCCEAKSCSTYSYYFDSKGCRQCCEARSCGINGSYLDSNGCTQCCEAKSCRQHDGFYLDSNGCKQCCVFSNWCPRGASHFDSFGRMCCSSR